MRLTVTQRIALLSIALALVSNLALVGFVWRHTRAEGSAAVRRETIEQADALELVWRSGGRPALVAAVSEARAPGDASLVSAVLAPDGRRLAGYGPPRATVPLTRTGFRIAPLGEGEGSWGRRETGYALRPVGGEWLLAGRKLDSLAATERALGRALGFAALISLALGVGGGVVLARYVGARLDRIAGVVEAAGEGDLSRRVEPVAGGDDAFDRLAGQLNAMLAKVEALMAELRIVTDSLAHDLRSPLSRLRTRAEQAVLATDTAARDAALSGLVAETDLVLRMLTTAIEISRSEQVTRDRFTRVAPAQLIEAVAELYEPVMEEAGIAFSVVIDPTLPPLPLHRELLAQAITNLLDNALRHAAGGGEAALRLAGDDREVAIAVEDRGPGIAAHDRAQAIKRFGRLDSARSTPGAGLGMALVEAVARLHGGRFELADNRPGLIARLVLPVRG